MLHIFTLIQFTTVHDKNNVFCLHYICFLKNQIKSMFYVRSDVFTINKQYIKTKLFILHVCL